MGGDRRGREGFVPTLLLLIWLLIPPLKYHNFEYFESIKGKDNEELRNNHSLSFLSVFNFPNNGKVPNPLTFPSHRSSPIQIHSYYSGVTCKPLNNHIALPKLMTKFNPPTLINELPNDFKDPLQGWPSR